MDAGLTRNDPPVIEYVLAPDGTTEKEFPEQILPLNAVTNGNGFTVTMATAGEAEMHPKLFVPLME